MLFLWCVCVFGCRIWFVDLAGSERASDSNEDRQSRMEAAEINQSLLAVRYTQIGLYSNNRVIGHHGGGGRLGNNVIMTTQFHFEPKFCSLG